MSLSRTRYNGQNIRNYLTDTFSFSFPTYESGGMSPTAEYPLWRVSSAGTPSSAATSPSPDRRVGGVPALGVFGRAGKPPQGTP